MGFYFVCMKRKIVVALLSVGVVACTPPKENKNTTKEPTKKVETVKDPLTAINDSIKADPNNINLYISKAKLFEQQGKVERSLEELDRALKIDSNNIEGLMQKSNIYYKTQRFTLAKEHAEKVMKLDDKNVESRLRMAWIYYTLNNSDKCFELISEALKIDLYNANAYFIKGLMYKAEGKYKLAVSSFRTATEQDNDFYSAWVQLGLMHALADDNLAVAYYDNAIRVDPKGIDARYSKAMFLQEHGQPRKALEEYALIMKSNPSFNNANYNSGFVYSEILNNQDSAIIFYDKYLGQNPFNHKAFYNRGLAYERKGDKDNALRDFSKALQLKPDYDPAAKGKSRLLK